MRYELWLNYDGSFFVGTYESIEDARIARQAEAKYHGLFVSDFSIIEVC